MRSGDHAGTQAVEEIPESLGIALGVRHVLGLPGPLPLPGPPGTQPRTSATDEPTWNAWWSYLVGGRITAGAAPADSDVLAALAGPHRSEARDWFAGSKMAAARRLSGHPLSATPGWTLWTGGAGTLRIDVLPVDDPYVVRLTPFCWLMSLGSRLDEEAVAQACRRDLDT